MKPDQQNIDNKIWHNFFICSANSFAFDLLDKAKDLDKFSTEQIYNMVAVCDNIAVNSRVFKEELVKRVELGYFNSL